MQGLTFGACRVYGAALAPPRDDSDWRRPVTLLALAATVLLSLSNLSLFGLLAPARILALVLVLAAAYLGGSGAGAAAGVAFGAAMDLCAGYGALFTCCYGPVSYTHLDVYKRQVPQRALRKRGRLSSAGRGEIPPRILIQRQYFKTKSPCKSGAFNFGKKNGNFLTKSIISEICAI